MWGGGGGNSIIFTLVLPNPDLFKPSDQDQKVTQHCFLLWLITNAYNWIIVCNGIKKLEMSRVQTYSVCQRFRPPSFFFIGADPQKDIVHCPVKAGGVVFFNNLAPHRRYVHVVNSSYDFGIYRICVKSL